MAENEIVTSKKLSDHIEHLQVYGEYDSYHEWSLAYTLKDKTEELEKMLKAWGQTDLEGKKVICHFIRTLIKDSMYSTDLLTNVLVQNLHIPEIAKIISQSLNSGIFSGNLLASMKQYRIINAEWITAIRNNRSGENFLEKKKRYDVKGMYKLLDEFLADFTS